MKKCVAAIFAVAVVCLLPLGCAPGGAPGGSMKVDTVQFIVTAPPTVTGEAAPGLWINTNTKMSFATSQVKSRKPYGVQFDYTDNSATREGIEITALRVTYEDGSADPAAAKVSLPKYLEAKVVDTVNSGAGGKIVKGKVRVMSGALEGVITRDAPVTVVVEGRFRNLDGSFTPFIVQQSHTVNVESASKPALEVLQDK